MAERNYHWYDDAPVVRKFLRALITAEAITEIEEVEEFLKKPSAYTEFETAWENADSPLGPDDEGWDDFMDDLNGTEEEEEEDDDSSS